jgi:hypothetical protein
MQVVDDFVCRRVARDLGRYLEIAIIPSNTAISGTCESGGRRALFWALAELKYHQRK